ncbi:GNAT family N-acetyltransferase [Nocardia brasiliensis]|uniref:GNAT family N-acetyltransferase n=1 Tax=Nocardia brasiliensis TaxID=37326 RepID=UPI002456ED93|nr:GNAT family N-acetyltransferase [Nocardia brasiliensis]
MLGVAGTADIEQATAESVRLLVELSQEFYVAEGYPFDQRTVRSALHQLVDDGTHGQVWLIRAEGLVVGYATVTYGFSVEFGGRFALLDEFYIRPTARNGGLGKSSLHFLLDEYSRRGFGAMRLEVEHRNSRAAGLYSRLGFHRHERSLMTTWLTTQLS